MVEKVDRYVAKGGREFISEESAHRHEAVEAMIAAIPELTLIRPRLEASMNVICQPVAKLARFLAENHPESSGETTLEPCCVNTPRGQDHNTDCPRYDEADSGELLVFSHEQPEGVPVRRRG